MNDTASSSSTLSTGSKARDGKWTMDAKICWLIVAVLTLVAGILRFWKLGHASLWGDEIIFVDRTCYKESLAASIECFRVQWLALGYPAAVPLPHLIEFFVLKLNFSEFWARLPAAVMGTLTIPVVFLVGQRLFDRATGLIAAALAALSFFLIYYSREAYFYSPVAFFSTCFFACAWWQLDAAVTGKKRRWAGLLLMWICGAGALLSHLTAVFFVAALGVAFLVRIIVAMKKGLGSQRMSFVTRRFLPFLLVYALCWIPVAPFLWHSLHNPIRAVPPPSYTSLSNIVYLPFQMGYGKIWPAEILFLACLLTGVFAALYSKGRRWNIVLCLWIIVFFLSLYLIFNKVSYYAPRYLITLVTPLLLIAAVGMRSLTEWMAVRLRSPALSGLLVVCGLFWLALFELKPLGLLYQLPGKPTDWRGIARWMSTNLPRGSVVFFDWHVAVWQMVPGHYPAPGIRCTFSMKSPDDVIPLDYRTRTGALLEKFSDAAYLEAMRVYDDDLHADGKWDWPSRYFRHKKSFRNEPALQLEAMKLYPIGIGTTPGSEAEPILHYNTREDLVAIHRDRGDTLFRRFGEGFDCMMTQNYQSRRTLAGTAKLEVYNLTTLSLPFELQLIGQAVADTYTVTASVQNQDIGTVTFTAGQPQSQILTGVAPPGKTDVQFRVEPPEGKAFKANTNGLSGGIDAEFRVVPPYDPNAVHVFFSDVSIRERR